MSGSKLKVRCCIDSMRPELAEILTLLRSTGFEVTSIPVTGLGSSGIEANVTLPDGSPKTFTDPKDIYKFVEDYKQGKYQNKNGK